MGLGCASEFDLKNWVADGKISHQIQRHKYHVQSEHHGTESGAHDPITSHDRNNCCENLITEFDMNKFKT